MQSYFGRFGYSTFTRDLASRLQGNFAPMRNMVDHLVDTRNKIAHGDPLATKTPAEVAGMVKMIKEFCRSSDFLFSSWWKVNFCAIR
ncbi:HEPN domain-containing protein [Achromobacter ruhlandii]|uniref:HEPN domain-containing protein n=1 Tax=Achromobacter ruhlandii TaxID=72557 RepID=UPI00387E3C03